MSYEEELANANSQLERMRNRERELRGTLNGGKINTDLGFDALVKGDWKTKVIGETLLKIEGGRNKIQIGPSDRIVAGLRGEYIAPWSSALTLITDFKRVLGYLTTRVYGLKKDTVTGAKWDELHGIKYEKKAIDTLILGGAPQLEKEEKQHVKAQSWVEKIIRRKFQVDDQFSYYQKVRTEIGELNTKSDLYKQKIGKLEEDYEKLKAEFKKAKVKATGTYILEVKGAASITASDYVLMKGYKGDAQLMLPYAKIAQRDSYVFCSDSKVVFKSGGKYFFK